MLLEHNAESNVVDSDGVTPLMRAAMWGHEAVVSLLLSRSADVNTVANNGSTAVAIAEKKEFSTVVIARGPEVCRCTSSAACPLRVLRDCM